MRYLLKHIISVVILLLFCQCKKTNWQESFRENDTEPFGTYIIYNEIDDLLKLKNKEKLKVNLYDHLMKNFNNYDLNTSYICIKKQALKLSDDSIDELFEFVNVGNDAFLSLENYPKYLLDSLKLEIENTTTPFLSINEKKLLEGNLSLIEENFNKLNYKFKRNIKQNYFSFLDEEKHKVLGHQLVDSVKFPNFIKIEFGLGNFYLHTQPIVFTNYHLKNKNQDYASNALSYLNKENIIWDPQLKYATNSNKKDSNAALSFFMKNESLKWSLYVSFFSLLLFLLVNSKRKQRPIPLLEKPKNTLIEFTKTISNLYFKQQDHKNLVDKKINYFLEKVRSQMLLDTNNLNNDFVIKLANKTNNSIKNTQYLVNTIILLNNKEECTQTELLRINTLIDNYFK